MVWEFPAVSHTRKDFWGEAQYSRKSMLLITIFLGIFGFHHLYLRSSQTAFLFFIGNILSLGYWWFYDIVQLSSSTPEELNKYGLSLPWGPAGIAQGMFQCTSDEPVQSGGGSEDGSSSPPHPIWFTLSCLLLPLSPLSMMAAGDTGGALIRFISYIFILFLFPFLAISYFYDLFQILAQPSELLKNGYSRFFPFTLFGFDSDNQSPRIQTPLREKEEKGCPPSGVLSSFFNFFASGFQAVVTFFLPVLSWIVPAPVLATLTSVAEIPAKVVPVAVKAVDTVSEKIVPLAQTSVDAAVKLGQLAIDVPTKIASRIEAAGIKAKETYPASSFATLPTAKLQLGGGQAKAESMSTADKWAAGGLAALLGGGFLLTAGRSFYDVLQHYNGPTDSPPQRS